MVTKKESSLPTFNGTVYFTKTSTGNLWAWDNAGNYFDSWPGKAINTLETATVNGVEYYAFTFSHNAAIPRMILNDGSKQTADIVPEDGKVYSYVGGTNYTVSDPADPEPVYDRVWMIGDTSNDGWNPSKGVELVKGDDGLYTTQVTTTKDKSYFSFTHKLAETETGWDDIAAYRFGATSDGYALTAENLGNALPLGLVGTSNAFVVPAGEYTFAISLTNRTLTITGTIKENEVEIPNEVYIIGQVDGGDWSPTNGVKMQEIGEKVFEATVIFDGVCEAADGNVNFFGFTHKLTENEGDWDAIKPYRFGAIADGDYWVTDEQVENHSEISLTEAGASNAQSLRIHEGQYVLTVNLNTRTLVIAKVAAPVQGDVNGDGNVDVADVTALIGFILQPEGSSVSATVADVDLSGEVNVADVTALIAIILNKE